MKGHREPSPGHWAIVIDVRDLTTGKRRRCGTASPAIRWSGVAGVGVNARAAGMFPIGVAGIPVTAVPGGGG
jgi:hypothetical protein